LKSFKKEIIISILENLKTEKDNILYEIWSLSYHMHMQRNEILFMSPKERGFWIEQLIIQRKKENDVLD